MMKNILTEWRSFINEQPEVGVKTLPTLEQVATKFEEELAAGKLSPMSIVYLLHKFDFKGKDLFEGTHIVLGESTGVIGLEQSKRNKDGTTDHGLWQINDKNLLDSKFYNQKKQEAEKKFDDTIQAYKKNTWMTPEQKEQKIKQVEQNKKKYIEKLDSGFGVPFISLQKAMDAINSTAYVKSRMELMRKKFGEDGKWRGWVPSISRLPIKYGTEKQKIANETVKLFNKIISQKV
jgi:hypothetical protein